MQADLDRHTTLDWTDFDQPSRPLNSSITYSSGCVFQVIKDAPTMLQRLPRRATCEADVIVEVLSFAERSGLCLSIASTNPRWKFVFPMEISFSNTPHPDTHDANMLRLGNLASM